MEIKAIIYLFITGSDYCRNSRSEIKEKAITKIIVIIVDKNNGVNQQTPYSTSLIKEVILSCTEPACERSSLSYGRLWTTQIFKNVVEETKQSF